VTLVSISRQKEQRTEERIVGRRGQQGQQAHVILINNTPECSTQLQSKKEKKEKFGKSYWLLSSD
jgi:hypothetical protein